MRRARSELYYGALPAAQPEPLIGAAAIAGELGITTKQLYRMLEAARRPGAAEIPIGKAPGLGLVAQRPALRAWWAEITRAVVATGRHAA